MPERLFPTLERTDLIVHTYDAGLLRALTNTDATPNPGSSVELGTGAVVTFRGSFVRRGEPGPDAHLFAMETGASGDAEAIGAWLTEVLADDPFATVETSDGMVDPETDDLETALGEPLVAE